MTNSTPTFTMKLEVVMLPVTDVDQSIDFYQNKISFNLDHDVNNEGMRIVQLTPPGSTCSIVIGTGMEALDQMQAGSIHGLHLVVDDIESVRSHLVKQNVKVSDIIDYGDGIKMAGFSDLDGNSWALQEIVQD